MSGDTAASDPTKVSAKVEAAFRYRLNNRALQLCKEKAEAFAACTENRTLSVVWACRDQLSGLNTCLHQHTNPAVLEAVKRKWIGAGRPPDVDWDTFLDGMS